MAFYILKDCPEWELDSTISLDLTDLLDDISVFRRNRSPRTVILMVKFQFRYRNLGSKWRVEKKKTHSIKPQGGASLDKTYLSASHWRTSCKVHKTLAYSVNKLSLWITWKWFWHQNENCSFMMEWICYVLLWYFIE